MSFTEVTNCNLGSDKLSSPEVTNCHLPEVTNCHLDNSKSFDRDYQETTTETTTDIKKEKKEKNTIPEVIETPVEQTATPPAVETLSYEKRVCNYFDTNKKKIQPNFMRSEINAEYLLRLEFDKGRTPEQFKEAIDYLFNGSESMQFWVKTINTIAGLIKHFNTIEADSISQVNNPKNIELNEQALTWSNVLRKQGISDEEILVELQKNGFIAA